MGRLLRIEEFNSRRSSSRENSREYEEILAIEQPAELYLSNLTSPDTVFVTLEVQGEIEVTSNREEALASQTFLRLQDIPQPIKLLAKTYSEKLRDRCLQLTFLAENRQFVNRAIINLTAVQIRLDVDADRDGIIEEGNPHKAEWTWGKNGSGAILLVNNDRDVDSSDTLDDSQETYISGLLDLKDFSFMIIRKVGPRYLPSGYELSLSVNRETARRIRIFDELDRNGCELISPAKRQAIISETEREIILAIEGLSYPSIDFDGLVEISLNLLKDRELIYSDKVVFRVAPWLMTPNTLSPKTVYVSRLSDGLNEQFIEDLRKMVGQANAQLEVAAFEHHGDDPWMQDELEIGYTQAPGRLMYVVLDSPRDRGLDNFSELKLLGTDFGFVTRGSRHQATKLDSFGNLEVSPPVTVNGVNYPFGRIIFGGTREDIIEDSRRMLKGLRDFFYAQKIQAPLEIFSDWLAVGHIDEFMTFVGTPTLKGFKLLLASPDRCYEVMERLQNEGQGHLVLREGKQLSEKPADISINEVLAQKDLAHQNRRFQDYINGNRDVLTQELGLESEDIISLPALFSEDRKGRAETFFPNLVNMIVLDEHLGIPKPFGPRVNGECQFEAYVKGVLTPLGLVCHFIDDWEPYFQGRGEIHCGTNTRRQAFPEKWWEIEELSRW